MRSGVMRFSDLRFSGVCTGGIGWLADRRKQKQERERRWLMAGRCVKCGDEPYEGEDRCPSCAEDLCL